MIKKFLAVLMLTSMGVLTASAEPKSNSSETLSLIVKVPFSTPQDQGIFLTGESDELCHWQVNCLPMKKIGAGLYRAELARTKFPVQFKVTRGSWSTESSDSFGAAMPNLRTIPAADENVVTVLNWKDQPAYGVVGKLDIINNVYSPQLGNSRTVRIWLPPGYDPAKKISYPVIYAHDGQNLFNPNTASFGVEWNIDEVMVEMIRAGSSAPAIVVGIDSGADRWSEYDYNERGALYASFIVNNVKPYIDSHYRTLPGREHTFTIGSSMGGYISFALLWAHSETFSRAAALSLPAFIQNRAAFRFLASTPSPYFSTAFYQDYGDFGGDADYPGPAQEFAKLLMQKLPATSVYELRAFPYADHFEADWSRRVNVPLQFLLKP